MILVRTRTLLLFLAISVAAVVAAAAWTYGLEVGSGHKGEGETALFLGLAAGAAEIGLGALLFSGARKKRRELDSLVEVVRHGGSIPDERLRSFGPLGERLRAILKELSDVSERKSVRIASLTGLLRAALALVERPIIVTSLDGRIVEASRGAREDPRLAELDIGSARLEDLSPDLDPRSVFQEADRTHAPVEKEGLATFYPVYSVNGEMGHFLVDLSRSGVKDLFAHLKRGIGQELDKRGKTSEGSTGGGILGFVRSFGAKKK